MASATRQIVCVVFTRARVADGKTEVLLKNKPCEAGTEWVLPSNELQPDSSAKNNKTIQNLAAFRAASQDLGQCPDIAENDFAALGGSKERLPSSLLSMKWVKPESSNGFKTFCFLCRLESAEDQVFAAFCEKQPQCKWFVLSDLLNKSSQGVAAWLSPLLEKVHGFQPGAQGGGVQRHNGGGMGATEPFTSPKIHKYNKPQGARNGGAPASGSNGYEQGNMAPNAYGTDGIISPYATGGYPMHAPNATSYMNTPSQMESSLKFKFPAHIVSIVVRTTGCKLGKDQVVAIGAAFVKIPNSVTVPIIVKHELFRCQVDAPQKLDPNYMSAEELAELQIKATPGNVAVKGLLDFVEGCMRQDAGSYIAAQNPMVELGMLELAAGKHVEGFTSLSDIGVTAGGPVKVPIDLSSLACGLVSTDGKAPSAAGSKPNTPPTSKQPTNGGPWATLSQYLQQHITAGEFDKHLPFPQKTAGRLEPHEEAANKGWYFGNTLCVLADKHQKANNGMGMINPNAAMMQAFHQQNVMQQWQMQHIYQMQQMAYNQQQPYGGQAGQHAQSHTPHHRMPPHSKQPRHTNNQYNQYNNQQHYTNTAGRGGGSASGYQASAASHAMPQATPMAPQPQSPTPPTLFANARPNMPAPDASQSAKLAAGTPRDAIANPLTSPVAVAGTTSNQLGKKEGGETQSGEVPVLVSTPAVVETPKIVQATPPAKLVPAAVPAQKGPEEAAPTVEKAPTIAGVVKEEGKGVEGSEGVEPPKPDNTPKSWAQRASQPKAPQAAVAPSFQPISSGGHADNGISGVATGTESTKDVGRRESGEGGEPRSGYRREQGQGRGDGGRKDSAPAGADRGGGRGGKGNAGGRGGGGTGGGVKGDGGGRGGESSFRGARGGPAGASAGRGSGLGGKAVSSEGPS